MAPIPPEQLIEQLEWRYAVKRFDPDRRIDEVTWQALERCLILTPSSYGLQPWKFIVITDPEIKAQLPALSWGQKQPQDCSHMVVLAARRTMDAEYIQRFMESVVQTRDLPSDAMQGYQRVLVSTVEKMDSHLDWNARQVYIALGQLMVGAAMLGVDTCPMEGIDTAGYDRLLGLEESEYTTVVGCAVGFRHPDDAQARATKVRFSADELIERF
ncbi:MAG: NAD(P)H-dependent oxidoreductase [Planctomycetota bacterium]|nr:MAG: NAD(P)H-dependent oxidoreductase [Planctomycetota bacterium]